jgi:putative transposase
MKESTTQSPTEQPSRLDIRQTVRHRVREAIELVMEEELEAALGVARYERGSQRSGYRNGHQRRRVLTEHGPTALRIPRGRLGATDGSGEEWHSQIIDPYQRRTRKVEEAILGCYLGGVNTRRIRRSLLAVFGRRSLSKSAISRVVSRLKERFESWRCRDLAEERILILYLDAMHLAVRLARRVVKVPVQAVLGVREDGQKVLLSLQIAGSESTVSWRSVIDDLARRGLAAPVLVVVDGNRGLSKAIRTVWRETLVQRCTRHKRENLLAAAPKHCHEELKRDYRTIVAAKNLETARVARQSFLRKWETLVPAVARSLAEAGDDLLTFYHFPKSQWKCLRTTNPIERINGEFRRRTKTQGAFTNESSALVLLYGLFAAGQIIMRRIHGWRDMPLVAKMNWKNVA